MKQNINKISKTLDVEMSTKQRNSYMETVLLQTVECTETENPIVLGIFLNTLERWGTVYYLVACNLLLLVSQRFCLSSALCICDNTQNCRIIFQTEYQRL